MSIWKRSLAPILVFMVSIYQPAAADETADDGQELHDIRETLQRIEQKTDRLTESAARSDAALIEQPLGDRRQGIEFNFFGALTWGDYRSLSGTYSRFYTDRNVEIAIPLYYGSEETSLLGWASSQDHNFRAITADLHYRQFLRHNLDGFYLSGFTRLAHLSGTLWDSQNGATGSQTKVGVGVGLGYRIFSSRGLYWGASFSLGRYLNGDHNVFRLGNINDQKLIVDVEFLKFGYAFE